MEDADHIFNLQPFSVVLEKGGVSRNCIGVINLLVCLSALEAPLPRVENAARQARSAASNLWKEHKGEKGLEGVLSVPVPYNGNREGLALTLFKEVEILLDSLRKKSEYLCTTVCPLSEPAGSGPSTAFLRDNLAVLQNSLAAMYLIHDVGHFLSFDVVSHRPRYHKRQMLFSQLSPTPCYFSWVLRCSFLLFPGGPAMCLLCGALLLMPLQLHPCYAEQISYVFLCLVFNAWHRSHQRVL